MILHCRYNLLALDLLRYKTFTAYFFYHRSVLTDQAKSDTISVTGELGQGTAEQAVLCTNKRRSEKEDCLFKPQEFYVREGKGEMRLRNFITEDNEWQKRNQTTTALAYRSMR